jgi:hypothetical protein
MTLEFKSEVTLGIISRVSLFRPLNLPSLALASPTVLRPYLLPKN